MAALIDLCNSALNEIAQGTISTIDETSIEAQKCRETYPSILTEMVEWSDCFPFARTRVELAQTTNDRPAEWLYAYAAPSDMAAPLAIRQVEDDATDLPIYGPFNFPLQDEVPIAFGYEGNRIFTNVENATLIYTVNTLDAAALPALGQRAFVLEMAARLANSLPKDPRLAKTKRDEAELARARFVADEENKAPRKATRYVSEVEFARMGYGV